MNKPGWANGKVNEFKPRVFVGSNPTLGIKI